MDRFVKSKQLLEESRRYLAGGVSTSVRRPSRPVPLFFEKGEGAYLFDVDGNRYIDYTLGWGPLVLGHSHPAVVETVSAQLRKGQTYGGQHRYEIEVAKKLAELVPCAELVCFSNTGTEAVMSAIRFARAYTGRSQVIKFEGHYHGWSDGVYVSYVPTAEQAGPYTSPNPVPGTSGIPAGALGGVLVAPWNDLEVLERTLDQHRGKVAAIIMEPYAFNTGVVFPAKGYMEGVRRLADRHGVVLIFDEVITGFRVGLHSAQGRLGVTPDLAIFGKALAGGFPLSVVAGSRKILSLVADGKVGHAGTFNGNPIVTSAAAATLEVLSRDGGAVYGMFETLGSRLAEGLREAGRQAEVPVLVNQVGSVLYMHITDLDRMTSYRDLYRGDLPRYSSLTGLMTERGVYPTWRGLWYLSTAHTEKDVDQTIASARESLSRLAAT